MAVKVAVGADHGGFRLKKKIITFLLSRDYEVVDLGAYEENPEDDYPDFAKAVANEILSGRAERGIIICGSGVGASVAASKVQGIRAAVCHDSYSAHQGVEHDDMNVVCLGERILGEELAKEIVALFLGAVFTAEERHVRRLEKVREIEEEGRRGPGSP
jgi:ribose 5-phosphate isomerase B